MDPREVLTRAREAAQSGKHEEALRDHLWFHDHAVELVPSLYGVRLSFALGDWMGLAQVYPPALTALLETRNRKRDALLHGIADRELFHDVSAINRELGEAKSTYDLFRRIEETAPAFAVTCAPLAFDEIIAAGDFYLAARYSLPAEESLLKLSEELNETIERYRDRKSRAPVREAVTSIYVHDVQNCVNILVNTGRRQEADFAREWAVALVEDRRIRERIRVRLFQKTT